MPSWSGSEEDLDLYVAMLAPKKKTAEVDADGARETKALGLNLVG